MIHNIEMENIYADSILFCENRGAHERAPHGPDVNIKNNQKSSDLISCQSGNFGLCVWQVWTMGLLDPK